MLVVGLGNIGPQYDLTRHNMGFLVLDAFARAHGWNWKAKRLCLGQVCVGQVQMGECSHEFFLLKPSTYMNLSGQSVKAVMDYFGFTLDHLVLVCDDVHLPFGELRLRRAGSSGGHNGLKSIEATVGSRDFARLRIGVGDDPTQRREDFVLGHFGKEEELLLTNVCQRAINTLERWPFVDLEELQRDANNQRRRENKEGNDDEKK